MMFYILCAMSSTNKKSLKRGLTPSRKKARRPAKFDLLDILDDMHACCRTIATVAGLLEAGNEFLQPEVVRNAGSLIADAERELKALLKTVWKGAAQ
jgi:hypothetical protein